MAKDSKWLPVIPASGYSHCCVGGTGDFLLPTEYGKGMILLQMVVPPVLLTDAVDSFADFDEETHMARNWGGLWSIIRN